jgi:hypothetical protein
MAVCKLMATGYNTRFSYVLSRQRYRIGTEVQVPALRKIAGGPSLVRGKGLCRQAQFFPHSCSLVIPDASESLHVSQHCISEIMRCIHFEVLAFAYFIVPQWKQNLFPFSSSSAFIRSCSFTWTS